jgi:hypothetical protein
MQPQDSGQFWSGKALRAAGPQLEHFEVWRDAKRHAALANLSVADKRSRRCAATTVLIAWARILALVLTSLAALQLQADLLELTPAADTTLAEVSPGNNFGGADFFNSGTAGNRRDNRGLLRFDLAALPSGAVLQSAELFVDVVREPEDGLEGSTFELHRALVSWGEGAGVPDPLHPGRGVPAQPGEACWTHRFAGTGQTWSAPGGVLGTDFALSASGEVSVLGINDSPYTLVNTPQLLADLEFWRVQPDANFGWAWLSLSEGVQYTARSFGSREGLSPPVLRLTYTVPEPATLSLFALGLGALALRRRR